MAPDYTDVYSQKLCLLGADPSGRGAEGCALPSRLEILRKRCELSQWGPGQSHGRKRIFCII